jgi:hypothetical protein
MEIYEGFAEMNSYIERTAWDGLEHDYSSVAASLAGASVLKRAESVDFFQYEASLREPFAQALSRAGEPAVKAIYFEYDLDNNWRSAFYLCLSYSSEDQEDDDWAVDWEQRIPGPDLPAASIVYKVHGFAKTDTAKGITLYLVARTVAAFGRVVSQAPRIGKPICIGFHDQDPIMRIRER